MIYLEELRIFKTFRDKRHLLVLVAVTQKYVTDLFIVEITLSHTVSKIILELQYIYSRVRISK